METRPPSPILLPPSLLGQAEERVATQLTPLQRWSYFTMRQGMQNLENRIENLADRIEENRLRRLEPETTEEDLDRSIQEEKVLTLQRQSLRRRLRSANAIGDEMANVFGPGREGMPFSRIDEMRMIREVGNLSPEDEAVLPDNPPPTDEALAMLQRLGLRATAGPP